MCAGLQPPRAWECKLHKLNSGRFLSVLIHSYNFVLSIQNRYSLNKCLLKEVNKNNISNIFLMIHLEALKIQMENLILYQLSNFLNCYMHFTAVHFFLFINNADIIIKFDFLLNLSHFFYWTVSYSFINYYCFISEHLSTVMLLILTDK